MPYIKPTKRQKLAFDNLVDNGGFVERAMIDAKYSPATAKTPQKLTESKGFQQLIKESGLTEELIATSLVEDIIAKPKNRIGELRLGSEILGMKKVEGTGDKTLVVMISGETSKRYAINSNTSTSSN